MYSIEMNRARFAPDEWYHCYSRGVDKRTTFENASEYVRFVQLLYVCNSNDPVRLSDLGMGNSRDVFTLKRGAQLVHIGAYCLMPNHFHLLLKDCSENGEGISKFMQKLGTAYTMYFNMSRDRTGNLFVKPFRSRHVSDDRYFKRVAQYIHFNPIELFEPDWKEGVLHRADLIVDELVQYPFSSLVDFERGPVRPEAAVLDVDSVNLLKSEQLPLGEALFEAREYYALLA